VSSGDGLQRQSESPPGAERTPFDGWLKTLLVGDSMEMRRLRTSIIRAARSDLPVLIIGPTGVGKELVAEAVHRISGRPGDLVAINVCAIGESMFESALFGHVRGAFTGAVTDVTGLLAEADKGTLFLDEIGSLPAREQAKLLRVLETRTYRPVGASRDRQSQFRLVAATNEDLDDAVSAARFRDDLRHRLGRLLLRVPTLIARREDIPLLVGHFVQLYEDVAPVSIDREAMAALMTYDWPGNVRELRSVVSALVTFSEEGRVRRTDVLAILGDVSSRSMLPPETSVPDSARARTALQTILEECGYDTTVAAVRLGVHRGTVYRRMRALRLSVPTGARRREMLCEISPADSRE
jgi:two-component system, NtrC family, response regulator HydG